MGAIDLEIGDLFHTQRIRPSSDDPTIDELILAIAKADRKAGKRLSDEDKEAEAKAFVRTLRRKGAV